MHAIIARCLFLSCCTAALATFTGCGNSAGEKSGGNTIAHQAVEPPTSIVHLDQHKVFHAGIVVAPVERNTVSMPLSVPGRVAIDERRWVHVTARVGGRVERIAVVTNDHVREGDVVAELYSQEFLAMQNEFLQASERLARARRSGTEDTSAAIAILRAARRRLEAIGGTSEELLQLERTRTAQIFFRVRAPLAGTVLASSVRKGSFLQEGAELFEVADLSTVWVLGDVFESDLSRVHAGMRAVVISRAYADSFPGTIASIYNLVDQSTRTVKARIDADNARGLLKPGMFCTVLLTTELGRNTIRIPSSALLGETEHHFVFVALSDTTFEKRDIRTLAETRDYVEVADGVLEGEKIVVKGGFFLKSEMAKETFSEEH